jgi:hypothetical protein
MQPDEWVHDKKKNTWKSKYLYFHGLITGLVVWIFLWDWNLWYIAVGIAVLHLLIDLIKLVYLNDGLRSFTVDQILHVMVLIGAALIITKDYEWIDQAMNFVAQPHFLIMATGYLMITTPAGYFIGKATQKWRSELTTSKEERDSLQDAGIWIGILERVLVVTFVLYNQFEAIGFLIAAKSILRFSDKMEHNPRKQTEYVLIGTLISFTMALFIGLIIKSML